MHGVKGIAEAHIEAASLVSTSHFFTVDADNIVNDDFNWEKIVDFQKDDKRIHVWPCQNPVNGLIYGYGGVKLWPTDHIENIQEYSTDFTTSVATHGFKIHSNVASVTHFNTTAFNAWKSGFREAAKLASGNMEDERSHIRLMIWMSIGSDVEHGHTCIFGAKCGALFGKEYGDKPKTMALINDFDWLLDEYNKSKSFTTKMTNQLKMYDLTPIGFTKEQSKQIKKWIGNI